MNKIEKIIKQRDDVVSLNSNWRNYQEEVNKYVIPRKGWVNTMKQRGERLKFGFLYDSTAIRALKIMAAGFHSNLTNPATKWFNLRTRNIDLMEFTDVQIWFKKVEDIIFGILNSSNFDTTMQEFYLSVGSAGTSAILMQKDPKDTVRFTQVPVGQLAFNEDSTGRVNRMYRTFPLTAQQAFEKWGTDAGEAVTSTYEKKPNDKLEFIHYVGPRDKYDNTKEDDINMPFESLWIEKSKQHKIKESGYKNFPYAVGRFYKEGSDPMGYSPAMDVFCDIKLVSAQKKTMLRASMKQADPAYILPDKGFILPLNANPGATNYRKQGTSADDIRELPSSGNIPITVDVIKMVQDEIKEAFFVPLFQALSNITKTMTIPEIQRRIAENMVLLGPTVGRFTQEVLDNVLLWVFDVAYEDGLIPDPPEAIAGSELDIVYLGPLAKAQRESEVSSIDSFLMEVGGIANVKPEVLDLINEDKIVRSIAKIRGISPEMLNDDDTVKVIRQIRLEAQQAERKMIAMQQGADIVKTGSEVDRNLAGVGSEQ